MSIHEKYRDKCPCIITPNKTQQKLHTMKTFTSSFKSYPTKFQKDKHLKIFIGLFILFTMIGLASQATTYYSRTNNGNWNVNSTWSTVGYGNATNTGTYPIAGDIVNIGNSYTIYVNGNYSCATLNIGQGASGTLEFRNTSNYVLTVSGNITINTGAKLWYNTATNRTHVLNIGGNITNFGNLDCYYAANQMINVVINGTGNSTITGSGTWDFNSVNLSKSTITPMLDAQSINFETAIRTLIITKGTYNHNNTGTYNVNPTTNFLVNPNAVVKVPRGILTFANSNNGLTLQGELYVNGGEVRVGSTAGLQGIIADQNGATVPYLEVSSGTLTVYGGITYQSTTEPFNYRQTGGAVSLNSGTTGTNRQVFYVNDVAGSIFYMSSGTITLQKPNINGTTTIDFSVCGTNGTVTSTGGNVYFGNASTASGVTFNFRPYASATQPHFRISGPAAAVVTLRPSSGSTANFRLLSLYIENNKIFDNRSISGATGDNKQMTLMSTCDGINAIYNNGTFTARTGTVTFNTSGAQAIGGLVSPTFYNLSINNASHITLNIPANVSNFLSMVNGKLITTNTNILTCQASANASIGSATSYVDGPMVHTVATNASVTKIYPFGKGTAYRPNELTIRHSNTTSVTYRGEVFNSPATALPYTLPASIANISAVRYVKYTRQAISNFSNGRIKMYYGPDDLVLDYTSLLVAHDNGATLWQNFGGVATANGTGNILSNTFTNFHSYFALGNPPGGGNPLPVTLSQFNAKYVNNNVYVQWQTQTEINNDYFELQRSKDNTNYNTIYQCNGAGNSSSSLEYSFIDDNPIQGLSYYRLKQVDFDGHFEYFGPVLVNNNSKVSLQIFPNPSTSNNVTLLLGSEDLHQYKISVTDLTGNVVRSKTSDSIFGNSVQLQLDESVLVKQGIYMIKLDNGIEQYFQKLIIHQ